MTVHAVLLDIGIYLLDQIVHFPLERTDIAPTCRAPGVCSARCGDIAEAWTGAVQGPDGRVGGVGDGLVALYTRFDACGVDSYGGGHVAFRPLLKDLGRSYGLCEVRSRVGVMLV